MLNKVETTDLRNLFEVDACTSPKEAVIDRLKETFATGTNFEFKQSGRVYEVLTHTAKGVIA